MLAEIAELDIDVFAKEMFKVSSNISNKTPRELLNQDIEKIRNRRQNCHDLTGDCLSGK